MKVTLNIEKKYAYSIIGLLIILIGTVGLNATITESTDAWHNADKIKFTAPLDITSARNSDGHSEISSQNSIVIDIDDGDDWEIGIGGNLIQVNTNLTLFPGSYFRLPIGEHPPSTCLSASDTGKMYLDVGTNHLPCVCIKYGGSFKWAVTDNWGATCS